MIEFQSRSFNIFARMLLSRWKNRFTMVEHALQLTPSNSLSQGKEPHLLPQSGWKQSASETLCRVWQRKTCAEIGFTSTFAPTRMSKWKEELFAKLNQLNADRWNLDGILRATAAAGAYKWNRKLPISASRQRCWRLSSCWPGSCAGSGNLYSGHTFFGIMPAWAQGISLSTKGKHAVVIGRSNIVGRPSSILLSSNLLYGNRTAAFIFPVTVTQSDSGNHPFRGDIIAAPQSAESPKSLTWWKKAQL